MSEFIPPFWQILLLIGCILNFILFFKVWGMTNDIRRFLKFYMDDKGITLTKTETYKNSGAIEKAYVNKDGKELDRI